MNDIELGGDVYRNYCDMWRTVGALADPGSIFEVEQRVDMLLVKSHYGQRVPHMVLDPRVVPGNERAWASALIQEWAGEPVSLMVGIPPGAERGELVKALYADGFVQGVRPSVAMARRASPVFDFRDDVDIELTSSLQDLDDARVILGKVFGLPSEIFGFYTPVPAVRTYILRERGIGVAAACLCPFAGVAGIYSVGVLPNYRGRGYAQRLVLRLLSDAGNLELTTAVLSCEKSLVPLYRRLGFTTCCELTTYWMEAWWR
ncbi:MAG: GCN5-related N-acetyltransferase [Chloroflexi bacterium]|nr:GCN5-related N-acetyltransferase [Chloroflexota bacterium]